MTAPQIEHDPSGAAYESIAGELAALSPREILRVNVDVSRAASRVLKVAPLIRELLPDIERDLPRLDLAPVKKLETYALAAWYAHASAWRVKRLSATKELAAKAKPVRNKLLKAADVFSDAGFIDRNKVAAIRGGQGRVDMAKDMIALSHILQQAWARIGPNALVTPDDLRHAGELGEALINALAHGEREIQDQRAVTTDRLARAFTLLFRAYDIAQRAVVFLRWAQDDAWEIAPSLFDNGGGRRKSRPRVQEGRATAQSASANDAEPDARTATGGPSA